MSHNPSKSPKKPILLVQTTKVNATKPLINYSATSPRKTITKPAASSPFNEAVPHIPPIGQKQRQKEMMTVINSSQGIESPRSPRNSNQKTASPSSSGNVSPKKDSNESLKRQIRDQSKYSFQQSQLIKKLHSDLVRAELVTGSKAPEPNESTNQFTNLSSRLDFLVDNYISQNEKLKKFENGQIENQTSNLPDDSMKRAIQTQEVCKKELGENYTPDELTKVLQNKQAIPNVNEVVSRDITSFTNDLDSELGKKTRELFEENDNDNIIERINKLKELAGSSKPEAAQNNEDEIIQKLNRQHQQDMTEKDVQIKNLSDEVNELKTKAEDQNNEIQNLNITLDNNNKEHLQERENLERQLNQKKEELNNAYKQIEEKGIETDQQKRDREFSSRIREIFPNDPDENIPRYTQKDVNLAKAIRTIYSSGDDDYITNDVNQLRQLGPQNQSQIDSLNNEINRLKEESAKKDDYANKLNNEIEQKQKEIEERDNQHRNEIEQKQKEIEELTNNHRNEIEQKQKEIEEQANNHKNALEQKQKEIEEQANNHRNEIEQKQKEIEEQANNHRNEIEQKQKEIEEQANNHRNALEQKQKEIEEQANQHKNEIGGLNELIQQKDAQIDGYKSSSNDEALNKFTQIIADNEQKLSEARKENEENERKFAAELEEKQKAFDDLRNQFDNLNNTSREEIEKLKQGLEDSNNKLNALQQENSQKDDIINISKSDYEKLQKRLEEFIENTGFTKQQAIDATNKIVQLKQENEELRRQNKDFISDSEASLIAFKKENEEKLNFANQCRQTLQGDNDDAKLEYARELMRRAESQNSTESGSNPDLTNLNYNSSFANHVRSLFDNNASNNNSHSYASLNDNDKEIIELIRSNIKSFSKDNIYESVSNIFHPDLSNEDIKNHSAKVANAAEQFYHNSTATPALNALFNKASGTELNKLVEQMRQDPNESIRKNAEILSDALKDDRMSVEAEGMIATTLAMFLAQIGNDSPNQQ